MTHAIHAPRHNGTDTSRIAAAVASRFQKGMCGQVLALLAKNGPLTADEAAELLDRPVTTIRPRFTDLRHAGLIEDTTRRRRFAESRSKQIVWALTDAGRRAA